MSYAEKKANLARIKKYLCSLSDEDFTDYDGDMDDLVRELEKAWVIQEEQTARINKLITALESMRSALEFYADTENWNEGDMELGDRARKALEE